jgi:hypothetical protein
VTTDAESAALVAEPSITRGLVECAAAFVSSEGRAIPVGVVLEVIDTLALLASTAAGRLHLLSAQVDAEAPANVLARATLSALEQLPSENIDLVASALVVALRQLWHTGEGLAVLAPYRLPQYLASAIRALPKNSPAFLRVELLDSLLNFASTPCGAFMLLRDGADAVPRCVSLMHERFVSKAQVSKYEKHGFGILVMHVAAVAAGASALEAAGFFGTFLEASF